MLINVKEDIGKFYSKSDEGGFVGYSTNNKSYRIFNRRTLCVEESAHVIFDESRDMENLDDRYKTDLEELLQLQKDSLINDPSTDVVPQNGDMTGDGDAYGEFTEGPSMSSRDPEIDDADHDQMLDTTHLEDGNDSSATRS